MSILIISAAVTCASCYPVLRLLRRAGQLDMPNDRSSHTQPTPRGGGWAVLIGLLAGAAAVSVRDAPTPWWPIGGAIALAGVGALDDRIGLSPLLRLACQAGVGALIGFAAHGWTGAAVGMTIFVVTVNVVNFMDGINAITALTMVVWGFTALLVGEHEHLGSLTFLGAVTAGGALGFLPWNAPVARLFLGDVGSYLFGALVASGILVTWLGGASLQILLAPLAIYFADTAWTLLSRARHRQPLLEAHRSHVYQRLTLGPRPMPHLGVAIYAFGLAIAITLSWALLPSAAAGLLTAFAVGLYLVSPRLWTGPGEGLGR